jgi:hypothetical protein
MRAPPAVSKPLEAGVTGWVTKWLVVAVMALLVGIVPGTVWAGPAAAVPKSSASVEHPQPGDSPRISGHLPRVAPAPASFHRHDGGWVQFEYPPDMRQRIQPLIADADEFKAALVQRLGAPVLARVEVRIARNHREMATLAPEDVPVPGYASGVAYSQIGLILLSIEPRYPNSHHDLGEIFRHELAHVALHDATSGRGVPKWFNEGFAVHVSGESSITRMQTLWSATLANRLLPLGQLERSFPADPVRTDVAYAQAADVVRYLVRRQDRDRFAALFARVRAGQTFDSAVSDAYGVDSDTLESQWREDVAKRYTFWPVLFSSTVVWMGVLGLFVWGWQRRKRRDKVTLARWAREEAVEDARRIREAEADEREEEPPRLHVVLARHRSRSSIPSAPDEIPKVEHNGNWHTLH